MSNNINIPISEIEMIAIRAQGSGGQNVNKVSTAIHLRFDINNSSLSELYKNALLSLGDYRISKDGIIIIKAQRFRSQEKNRDDALYRLQELVNRVAIVRKKRKATKPSKSAKRQRVDTKVKRGELKRTRRKDLLD